MGGGSGKAGAGGWMKGVGGRVEKEGGWEKGGGSVDNLSPLRGPHVLEEE